MFTEEQIQDMVKSIPKLTEEEKKQKYLENKERILNHFPNEDHFSHFLFWMENDKLTSQPYKFKKEDYDFVNNYFKNIPTIEEVKEFTNKYAIK
jgi:hypothetical protein